MSHIYKRNLVTSFANMESGESCENVLDNVGSPEFSARRYSVLSERGIHGRPAAILVKGFQGVRDSESSVGEIRNVTGESNFVSLESIMGMFSICVSNGDVVEIRYGGRNPDELFSYFESIEDEHGRLFSYSPD